MADELPVNSLQQGNVGEVVRTPNHGTRVLLVAASMRFMGGQAVMAQRLVVDLRHSGMDVDFLPVDPQPPWPLHYLDRIKYVRTLVRSFCYWLSLLRTVPRHDVIHVFSASYWSFLISPAPAILVGRLFRKSVILNYHSGEAADHLRRSGWLTKWIMRRADCVLVQSRYLAAVFRQLDFAVVVIPNHVDISSMGHCERHYVHPRILVPRALEPLYNIPCALRAFRIIQEVHPLAEMTILGDGPQRRELKRLAAELGLRNVTFAGRVERERIAAVFQQHDLLLNTSSIDNMPVSLLEGMAAGLPIVTTGPGGIPDMIDDRRNGHIVALDDHAAAAARILELVANPAEVLRLSRAGKEEARRYAWQAVAPLWEELYRCVSGSAIRSSDQPLPPADSCDVRSPA